MKIIAFITLCLFVLGSTFSFFSVPQNAFAATVEEGTISNMGFGASNGERIDNFIRNLKPQSPMVGQGSYIIQLAKEYTIDPLMIVVMVNESQLCTDTGVVSPGGSDPDNYNCGGILWNTTLNTRGVDIARWKAAPGPTANGHVFTFVPTVQDGLGLFFNYLGVSSLYKGKNLAEFYNTYNPCNDPGNQGRYACGEEEMRNMLELIEQHAGYSSEGTDVYNPGLPNASAPSNSSSIACAITKIGTPSGPPPTCAPAPVGSIPGGPAGPRPTPPAVPDGNYVAAIQNQFDLTFSNFDQQRLQWAWEKLWEVSATKFPSLVKGTQVVGVASGSQQRGRTVYVRNNTDKELFNVILLHELGHIIWHYNTDDVSQKTQHKNALAQEGGVTAYGNDPCYAYDEFTHERLDTWAYAQQTEDYAEMITYYLNPDANEQTNCGTSEVLPFSNGKKPLHYTVAQTILGAF